MQLLQSLLPNHHPQPQKIPRLNQTPISHDLRFWRFAFGASLLGLRSWSYALGAMLLHHQPKNDPVAAMQQGCKGSIQQ